MSDAPPPHAAPTRPWSRSPANPSGTPRAGAVPRMETVRVTAPDLARRAALTRMRSRIGFSAVFFVALFGAVAVKLAIATTIDPMLPKPAVVESRVPSTVSLPPPDRAMITDRNGQIMAVSLPAATLYADPRQMIDTNKVAQQLKQALPGIDEALIRRRLASGAAFVYIDRQITPRQELAINDLGIPGLYFQQTQRRRYPLGRVAAQVLGGVNVDQQGIAGVEKFFNHRLATDPKPLRLSIDVRVQAILRDAVAGTVKSFHAVGGCGIVMDARNARVLGMVSIPDFDANTLGSAPAAARFNRCATGTYEPGSVFKLQTMGMALNDRVINVWDQFNTSHPISIGRFAITDYEPVHRWLYVPEILSMSSNIGAARIALLAGARRQRAWLRRMGLFTREGIELPEAAMPQVQPRNTWGKATTMTVAFGNGIAVTPLHLVTTMVALVDGGILYRPTLLARRPGSPPRRGVRVMSRQTSDTMRRLMRDVVLAGTGIGARVPGYFVGGKTGTSQKIAASGGYRLHSNLASFISAFPINAPRYVVYIMIDAPIGNASTGGYSTGGEVAGPAVGQVIARIGPMLGVMPETQDAATIQASLALPMQPAAPPGAVKLGPGNPGKDATDSLVGVPPRREARRIAHRQPAMAVPIAPILPRRSVLPPSLRHETALRYVVKKAGNEAGSGAAR